MKKNKKLRWIPPFILLLVSIWVGMQGLNLKNYVIYFLIMLANGQIRTHFLNGKFILLSVFIDLGLAYFLHGKFFGMTYLLLYIPLFDGLYMLNEEKIATTIVSTGVLYWIIKDREPEIVLMNVLLLTVLILLIQTMGKMGKTIKDLEKHYDENRSYSYQLEETKERLEKFNRNIESVAQLEERNRISREIHDTIGHKLTATLLQLEAVIRVQKIEPDTRKILESVRDNLSASVDILRKTVKKIGVNTRIAGINSIRKLVQEFEESTSVKVNLDIKGIVRKLYPSIELAIYKNIQEAMTNAIRHGMCTSIDIEINYFHDKVIFSVNNDGKGCEEVSFGMGLKGMKERIELVGGELFIVGKTKGFEIKGIIPVEGDVS